MFIQLFSPCATQRAHSVSKKCLKGIKSQSASEYSCSLCENKKKTSLPGDAAERKDIQEERHCEPKSPLYEM